MVQTCVTGQSCAAVLIIPCLGQSEALQQSIASARAGGAGEIIVVNDGGAAFEHDDARVINLPTNLGPSGARNAGWRAATSEFVTFLDCGDLWLPDRGLQLNRAIADGVSWATWSAPREKNGRWVLHWQRPGSYDLAALKTGCRFQPGSTLLIKRDLINAVEGYDPLLRRLEDYDLFLRLAAAGQPLSHIDGGKIAVTEATGGRSETVLPAAKRIEQKWPRDRLVSAYLAEERAAVALRSGQRLMAIAHLLSSQLLAPRARLHLQPATETEISDPRRL